MAASTIRGEVNEAYISILRPVTRAKLSAMLDSRKLMTSENNLLRDWRGLVECASLDVPAIRDSKISRTEHALHLWGKNGGRIGELWTALRDMDRYDVIEDTLELIYADNDNSIVNPASNCLQAICERPTTISEYDMNIITFDDRRNLAQGLPLQLYDALVLYADEEINFVEEMMNILEQDPYCLKLCSPHRDLIAGLNFEYEAVVRLIERCRRVVVVLSKSFFKSNANIFFINYAQARGIDEDRRIVIPCMVEPCNKPSVLEHCTALDYFRCQQNKYWNFWEKLADSVGYQFRPNRNLPSIEGRHREQHRAPPPTSHNGGDTQNTKENSFPRELKETNDKAKIMLLRNNRERFVESPPESPGNSSLSPLILSPSESKSRFPLKNILKSPILTLKTIFPVNKK